MSKMDVIGKRFGRLTVLRRRGDDRPDRYFVTCACDCGNDWTGYLYTLLAGDTKSCGCLNAELARKRNAGLQRRRDLMGARFGRLLVIDSAGLSGDRSARWVCRCDCGTIKEVSAHSLRVAKQMSCGCLQRETARELMTKHGRYRDKDYNQELSARRAALKRGATVEVVEPAVVYARDMGLCGICGLVVEGGEFHLDHRVPIIVGGEHSYANCQTTHALCNLRKNRKQMGECTHLWAR